jgi:hydrogenase maturation factor
MCLGKYGTITEVIDVGRAIVRYDGAGGRAEVSLAVLVAEGTTVEPGDVVMVSMGMALRVLDEALAEQAIRFTQEVT